MNCAIGTHIQFYDPTTSAAHSPGSTFTASLHIMTAVIGAGVLALPYSVAWLGWVAGPLLLTVFYLLTWLHASLLAGVVARERPQPRSYGEAVRRLLGPRAGAAISALQLTINALAGVAYTVAAAACARAVRVALTCPHAVDCPHAHPGSGPWPEALAFGLVQLGASQLRSLDEAAWASLIGAVTSLVYSAAALCVSVASVRRPWRGTAGGVPAPSPAAKGLGALDALGAVAFAFAFPTVLVEVQATIRPRPGAGVGAQMRRAIGWSLALAFAFYLGVGVAGYAAFGNGVADNVLAIPHVGPVWVLVLANAAVVIHLCSAYQVYSQPVFAAIERALSGAGRARSGLTRALLEDEIEDQEGGVFAGKAPPGEYSVVIPTSPGKLGEAGPVVTLAEQDAGDVTSVVLAHAPDPPVETTLRQRLVIRSAYVVLTTAIAAALPCFAQILGLIGEWRCDRVFGGDVDIFLKS